MIISWLKSSSGHVQYLYHQHLTCLIRLIDNAVRLAAQPLLRRPVHPRQSRLLPRLAVSDHVCDPLGGEEDDGHAVAVEAGEDVLVWLVGDGPDVRLEVGRVAHYCLGKLLVGFEKGLCVNCYRDSWIAALGGFDLLPVHSLST